MARAAVLTHRLPIVAINFVVLVNLRTENSLLAPLITAITVSPSPLLSNASLPVWQEAFVNQQLTFQVSTLAPRAHMKYKVLCKPKVAWGSCVTFSRLSVISLKERSPHARLTTVTAAPMKKT